MAYRNDDNRFDLDETAELPKVTHETTDIPQFGFPKDPEELQEHDVPFTGGTHTDTANVPSFPEDPEEELESTQDLPVVEETEISDKEPKNRKNKKGTFKKNPKGLNIFMSLITITVNVLVTFMMFQVTRYAAIGKDMFLYLNVGVLVVLILIDLLLMVVIRTRKIAVFVIDLLVLCLFLGAGGYGTYVLAEVNKNVDKITTTTQTEKEVSASLVIYTGTDGEPIVNLEDLNGRKVGISTGSNTGKIAEKKFESDGISVEWVECAGYDEVLQGLIDGTVDCAVLSTNWESQFQEDPALGDYLSSMSVLSSFSDTVASEGVAGADKDITKEPFTVLLSGENEGLADTIIVMSVNPVSMKVTMVSIPRDSYVPISCYNGGKSKINSAHASSEACLVQTVQNLTGITIDYTIEFNFASVIQVVDAVGGIEVNNPIEFVGQCWDVETDSLVNRIIPAGDGVHLDGQMALGFARERYAFTDGDFARQRHQQEVIEQVVSKLMASKSPQMFLDVLAAAGDNIKTNFTINQMTSFINYALQKSKRYYDQGNIAGIFNFVSSREYGYSTMVWNEGLQLSLYTYNLFNGSIRDNTLATERNLNLYSSYSIPGAVNWSAGTTYTPDSISATWYSEPMVQNVDPPVKEEEPVVEEEPKVEDPVVEQPPVTEDPSTEEPPVIENPPVEETPPVEEPPVEVPQEPSDGEGTGEQTE